MTPAPAPAPALAPAPRHMIPNTKADRTKTETTQIQTNSIDEIPDEHSIPKYRRNVNVYQINQQQYETNGTIHLLFQWKLLPIKIIKQKHIWDLIGIWLLLLILLTLFIFGSFFFNCIQSTLFTNLFYNISTIFTIIFIFLYTYQYLPAKLPIPMYICLSFICICYLSFNILSETNIKNICYLNESINIIDISLYKQPYYLFSNTILDIEHKYNYESLQLLPIISTHGNSQV
jgi:hypothetical protein